MPPSISACDKTKVPAQPFSSHASDHATFRSSFKLHVLLVQIHTDTPLLALVSRWDRLLIFGACNIAALACFVLCFALFPILWPVPRKFAILYVCLLVCFLITTLSALSETRRNSRTTIMPTPSPASCEIIDPDKAPN